jgi:hypothetical protein
MRNIDTITRNMKTLVAFVESTIPKKNTLFWNEIKAYGYCKALDEANKHNQKL